MSSDCPWCGCEMRRDQTIYAKRTAGTRLVVACSEDCLRLELKRDEKDRSRLAAMLKADGRPMDPRPRRWRWGPPAVMALCVICWAALGALVLLLTGGLQ